MKANNVVTSLAAVSLFAMVIQLTGCGSDDPEPVLPQVTTVPVSQIGETGAKSGGTIVSDGGSPVLSTGVCWSTDPQPTVDDDNTTDTVTGTSFVSDITGLTPGTQYYVRAYATNEVGTAYGNSFAFTTLVPPEPVTDFDGNVYTTVRIGSSIWTAENLKSLHYADGTTIEGVYVYDDLEANADIYGRLYTWSAAMRGASSSNTAPSGVQGACPEGFHVPSLLEWGNLIEFLGGEEVAGGKLKATGTVEGATGKWYAPNTGATNSTGFSALPGGYRYADDGSYNVLGYTGFWWSTTRQTIYNYIVLIGHEQASTLALGWGNDEADSDAFSCRCVKN